MRNRFLLFVVLLCTMLLSVHAKGKKIGDKIKYPYTWTTTNNPIVTHIYACDPSAKVFSDGKIWVITSHDADDATWYSSMRDYHLFSTSDLNNWTDHGSVLSLDDISWANSYLWAPDIVERDGKYYIYAPAAEAHYIGVFVSDHPEGPYKDAVGEPIVPITDVIDPMVFVDDDGQAYLYFSRRGKYCYVVKLKDNMVEVDGPIVELTDKSLRSTINGEPQFVEGPYVHKRNGIYYMTYPAKEYQHGAPHNNHTGDEFLCYATSKSPMGPFRYQGRISDPSGVHNIHPAVITWKGQDYMFYHNGAISQSLGIDPKYCKVRRSMCLNKLHYNEDGSIQFMEQHVDIFK